MSDRDAASLDALRTRLLDARRAGRPDDPLVGGPEHRLLAARVAAELRALVKDAEELAELLASWQFLAGMCGLFDELDDAERPARDWRARIEQALASIEEATA